MTTAIDLLRNPRFTGDDLDLLFGGGQDAALQWDTAETNDALKLGLKLNSAAQSGNFIIVNKDHITRNTALPVTADPRLVVWSGADPAAGGANKYLSLKHNQTDAVIDSGSGDLRLQAAVRVMIGGATAPSADSLAHLWAGDAGVVAGASTYPLVIESNAGSEVGIHILVPDGANGGFRVGSPADSNRAKLLYMLTGDTWDFYIAGNTLRLSYGVASFAFKEATTISVPAATNLTLNALTTGAVVVQSGGVEKIRANNTGLGFYAVAPVARQASAANLTNNVTAGGTDDTIANYTSLTTYSTDAAAIRNDIYQLARKLKQVNDALRLYGLLT